MALELVSGPLGQGTEPSEPALEGGRGLGGYILLAPQARHLTGRAQLEEANAGLSQIGGPGQGLSVGSQAAVLPTTVGWGLLALPLIHNVDLHTTL